MRRFLVLPALLALLAPAFAATDTLEPLKKAVAEEVARKAADEMHFRIRGRSLVIAPFRNDPEGLVAAAFKEQLSSQGHFNIVEPSMLREAWDKIVGNDKEAPVTADKAIELGKKLGAEAVLFGRVELLAIDEGRSACDVKIRIVETGSGDGIFIGRFRTDLEKSMLSIPHLQVWMYEKSVFIRVLVWVVALLILPFLALLARETLSEAPPVVPIALVLVMTALDIFFALLLMGFEADSIVKWILLVLALAASIFYNLTILAKVAQLQLPGKD